jgi:hypothetical protein
MSHGAHFVNTGPLKTSPKDGRHDYALRACSPPLCRANVRSNRARDSLPLAVL